MTADVGWEALDSRRSIVDLTGMQSVHLNLKSVQSAAMHHGVTTGIESGALPPEMTKRMEAAAEVAGRVVQGVVEGYRLITPSGRLIMSLDAAVRHGRELVADAYHSAVEADMAFTAARGISPRRAELMAEDQLRQLL